MNISRIGFNELRKTIVIDGMSPKDTVEAVTQLVELNFIEPQNIANCYFDCEDGRPVTTFENDYLESRFETLLINTIDLLRSDEDRECAIEIIKILGFDIFSCVIPIIKDPENYRKSNQSYSILIGKDGLFRWENDFGAKFIYD